MKVIGVTAAMTALLLGAWPAQAVPTPSPSLDSVLAAPPASTYARSTVVFMPIQGTFDAVDYLGVLTPPRPSQTLATLKQDGFVQGYGRAWVDQAAGRFLVEAVVAFSGAAGAARWLPEARDLDFSNQYIKTYIAVSGIENMYGAHLANPAGPAYVDEIGFIKGNDFFYVYLFGEKDDLGDTASKQAKHQYDVAPATTIPPTQWPENAANSTRSPSSFGLATPPVAVIIGAVAAAVLVLALVLVVVVLFMTRAGRSRPTALPAAGAGTAQLSADGNYWWDGQAWRNAGQTVPPGTQKSADGRYWWDGRQWRLIETAAPSS